MENTPFTKTVSDPQGRQLTFDSPDGSTPSEQELDQMFQAKYPQEKPQGIDIGQAIKPFTNPNVMMQPGGVTQAGMQAAGNLYGQAKEGLLDLPKNPANQLSAEGFKKSIPFYDTNENKPSQVNVDLSPRSIARGAEGSGVDLATGLAQGVVGQAVEKGIVGPLSKMGDMAHSAWEAPGKIKAAVGAEITPAAQTAASGRIKAMEPSALSAIGVHADDLARIGQLKTEFGINKFPTPDEADQFFSNVMDQAKNKDMRIVPETFVPKLQETIQELSSGLGDSPRLAGQLQKMLQDAQRKPITGSVYKGTRLNLNNLSATSPELSRYISPIKDAIDFDAAQAGVTGIEKAKAIYEMSKMTPKINTYLNNPKLGIQLQSLLEKAQKPESVQVRAHLRSLLGDKADDVFTALNKNRGQKGIVKAGEVIGGAGLGVGLIDYLAHRTVGRALLNKGH